MQQDLTAERQRVRWLALLIIIAAFGVLAWIFGWSPNQTLVVSTLVW
jgi:hypothetical protein